jgi:accessory gene regulator protein AgrB
MIENWAREGSIWLLSRSKKNVHPEVVQYGLHIFIESTIKLVIWFVIGAFVQNWSVWIAILLGFALSRMIMGGVHTKSFLQCVILTDALLLFTLLIWHMYASIENHSVIAQFVLMVLVLLLSIYLSFKGIPIQWGNRSYTHRRRKFTYVLFGTFILGTLTISFVTEPWSSAFAIAVLLSIIMNVPVIRTRV